MKKIYLDNNATTALDPKVIDEMFTIANLGPLNPSSVHSLGRKARGYLEDSRETIANFLHVPSKEIFFTSSGTESLNLLIKGMLSEKTKGHILSSNVEHSAVYQTLLTLEKKGFDLTLLSPNSQGSISLKQVEDSITPHTTLVALSWVNGETGAKTDIPAIASFCKEKNIPLIVDGVALMGKELFTIPEGVTGMAFAGHKFHGPKISFAYINKNAKITPQITGGHQEHSLRAGTEDLMNIVGLAKAVELLNTYLPEATGRMEKLRDLFESELYKLIPVEINGESPRICNVSNVYFKGKEAESLLFQLDRNGIFASHGSACSSFALEPSRILKNMGYLKDRVLGSIRFSFSRNTSEEDIQETISTLKDIK
jgi:cysteine desulfurase